MARKPFFNDRRGNVALILGLAMPVLIMTAGSAVDYARWASVQAAVQAQVDMAALHAMAKVQDADAFATVERALLARAETIVHVPTFSILSVARTSADADPEIVVVARAEGVVPTVFVKMLGIDEMPVRAVAEARRSPKTYEISLIVDVTGSMEGAKINALQDASRAFVRSLLPEATTSDRILVNIVPYTGSVNIGRGRSAWLGPLDAPPYGSHGHPPGSALFVNKYLWRGPSPSEANGRDKRVAEPDCQGTGVSWNAELELCHIGNLSAWTRPGPCPGIIVRGTCYVADGWGGCIEERGRGAHDVTDAPISIARFHPYYWASWEEEASVTDRARYNGYLPAAVDESRNTNASSNNGRGPNLGCPKDEITDWTNNRGYLLDRIEDFEAWHRGGTMGHIGLAWGWRSLSPQWAGQWGEHPAPRPYDRSLVEKIAVFMTDGVNGFYTGHAPPNDSDYTAYGRLLENPGVSRGNQQDHLDAKMLAVCTGMRSEGIELFAVGFGLSNNRAGRQARALLRDCASSEDYFFDATTSDLVVHFENIANNIRTRGERLAQ